MSSNQKPLGDLNINYVAFLVLRPIN